MVLTDGKVTIHKANAPTHGTISLFPTQLPVSVLNLDQVKTCHVCWAPSPAYLNALETVRDAAETAVEKCVIKGEPLKTLAKALKAVPDK